MRQIMAKRIVSGEDIRAVDVAEEAHAEQDVVRGAVGAREEAVRADTGIGEDADPVRLRDQGVSVETDDVERVNGVFLTAAAPN